MMLEIKNVHKRFESLEAGNDEFCLYIASYDHSMAVEPCLQKPHRGDLCADTGCAGIGDDNRPVRIAEMLRDCLRRRQQIQVVSFSS